MSSPKKILLGIVIVLVVIVIGLAIIVPLLVDVDRYRPQLAAYLQQQTGKPAEIGHLALTVFPTLAIRVDDFSLGNPPGFPRGYFVKTRRIYARVDAGALWDRRVIIESLELDDPAINLLSDVRGKWNFENAAPAKKSADPPKGEKPLFTLGVISKVVISGGDLAAANLLASGRPGPTFFQAHDVSSTLEQVDLNAFTESAAARSAEAPEFASHSPNGGFSSLAYAAGARPQPAAQGTLKAKSLRFGTLEITSVKTRIRLFPKQVFLDDLNFDCYKGHATGDFSFNFAGQNPRYVTNARLKGVDVAQLLAAFPDARGKMTGTLEGNIKLLGEVTHSPDPLAGMRGTGQFSIKNGQLPSLQLNRNLLQLARLAQVGSATGDPSSFSSVSADLNIANQRITSNKVTIVGSGVDVDGAGSMSLAGEGGLDYTGVAKLVAAQNPLTNILTSYAGATYADGKLTFPFDLAGTLQNPKFLLKTAGGAGKLGIAQGLLSGAKGQQTTTGQPGQPQPPADLVQGISGLFKKKQTTQQQTPPAQQPQQSQPPKQ